MNRRIKILALVSTGKHGTVHLDQAQEQIEA